jgi:hypothetical protein
VFRVGLNGRRLLGNKVRRCSDRRRPLLRLHIIMLYAPCEISLPHKKGAKDQSLADVAEPELGGGSFLSFPCARLPDAARDNDWEAVRELLFELGASAIDRRDNTGSNLLHWAIRHGKTRLIRVSHSASPAMFVLSAALGWRVAARERAPLAIPRGRCRQSGICDADTQPRRWRAADMYDGFVWDGDLSIGHARRPEDA